MKKIIRLPLCFALLCSLLFILCACSLSDLAEDVAMQKIAATSYTAATEEKETNVPPETEPDTEPTPTPPATAATVAGEYEFYSMSDGYETFYAKDMEEFLEYLEMDSLDDLMYLKLNEDGTGILSSMDIEGDIEWNDSHMWTKGDPTDRVSYTYKDNKITFWVEEYEITMQKIVISL